MHLLIYVQYTIIAVSTHIILCYSYTSFSVQYFSSSHINTNSCVDKTIQIYFCQVQLYAISSAKLEILVANLCCCWFLR